MGVEIAVRERATKATCLLVDGQPVNPWLVKIDFTGQGSSLQTVELRLGLPILVFELQQCEVNVNRDNVLAFVRDDIKSHRDVSLDGYLTIVRHVLVPPPRRKSLGWFARMLTPAPKWTPPAPEWNWTSVNGIDLSNEEVLVIRGNCRKVAS